MFSEQFFDFLLNFVITERSITLLKEAVQKIIIFSRCAHTPPENHPAVGHPWAIRTS